MVRVSSKKVLGWWAKAQGDMLWHICQIRVHFKFATFDVHLQSPTHSSLAQNDPAICASSKRTLFEFCAYLWFGEVSSAPLAVDAAILRFLMAEFYFLIWISSTEVYRDPGSRADAFNAAHTQHHARTNGRRHDACSKKRPKDKTKWKKTRRNHCCSNRTS